MVRGAGARGLYRSAGCGTDPLSVRARGTFTGDDRDRYDAARCNAHGHHHRIAGFPDHCAAYAVRIERPGACRQHRSGSSHARRWCGWRKARGDDVSLCAPDGGASIYLPEDIGALAPPLYHAAHRARVEAVKDEMKALCIDELHRTGGKPSFRRLLALDRREGRKHGIRVSLASQFIADFETDGEPITESAFSIYIMNAGTARSRAQAQTLFGLSDSAMQALQTEVRGAGRFLVWHQTKVGFITQVLHNAPSAIELWAF